MNERTLAQTGAPIDSAPIDSAPIYSALLEPVLSVKPEYLAAVGVTAADHRQLDDELLRG